MAKVTTFPQMQSETAKLASFIAAALRGVAESIEELESKGADVDLSTYLTKEEAAAKYLTEVVLTTTASTTEGAIWLEWS